MTYTIEGGIKFYKPKRDIKISYSISDVLDIAMGYLGIGASVLLIMCILPFTWTAIKLGLINDWSRV